MKDARKALINSLSDELGVDCDPEFLMKCDRILARLYMRGFVVTLHEDEEEDESEETSDL